VFLNTLAKQTLSLLQQMQSSRHAIFDKIDYKVFFPKDYFQIDTRKNTIFMIFIWQHSCLNIFLKNNNLNKTDDKKGKKMCASENPGLICRV